jgi:hypothetical protein
MVLFYSTHPASEIRVGNIEGDILAVKSHDLLCFIGRFFGILAFLKYPAIWLPGIDRMILCAEKHGKPGRSD